MITSMPPTRARTRESRSSIVPFNPATRTTLGNFIDPDLPAGFIPYGVRDLSLGTGSGALICSSRIEAPTSGVGRLPSSHNDGTFVRTDSPLTRRRQGTPPITLGIGLYTIKVSASSADDLLVGNFSSGQIDAYNLTLVATRNTVDRYAEKLLNTNGTPLTIPGLRSIHFGPGLGDFREYARRPALHRSDRYSPHRDP